MKQGMVFQTSGQVIGVWGVYEDKGSFYIQSQFGDRRKLIPALAHTLIAIARYEAIPAIDKWEVSDFHADGDLTTAPVMEYPRDVSSMSEVLCRNALMNALPDENCVVYFKYGKKR